jgi:hypothetical protein
LKPHTNLSFLRIGLISAIFLCLLVTGYSLLRYPGILSPLRVGMIYAGVLSAVLLSYLLIAWRLTSNNDSNSVLSAGPGLNWGLIIAMAWLIEIVAGNLLDPNYALVRIIYFGSTILGFSLPLLAGIWGTRLTGSSRVGMLVGLWSGIVSGLLTFLSLMTITYVFLQTMLQDPQNMIQFQGSGARDLATFVIGDSLAGATGHLVIGLVLGPGLGGIGGLIGKGLRY